MPSLVKVPAPTKTVGCCDVFAAHHRVLVVLVVLVVLGVRVRVRVTAAGTPLKVSGDPANPAKGERGPR